MSETKLLPCPFCGGKAEIYEDGRFAWVQCIDCNARDAGWTNGKPRPETAIKAWNTRPKCEDCKYLTDELFNDGAARYVKCLVIHAWISEFECKDFYCKKFERKEQK